MIKTRNRMRTAFTGALYTSLILKKYLTMGANATVGSANAFGSKASTAVNNIARGLESTASSVWNGDMGTAEALMLTRDLLYNNIYLGMYMPFLSQWDVLMYDIIQIKRVYYLLAHPYIVHAWKLFFSSIKDDFLWFMSYVPFTNPTIFSLCGILVGVIAIFVYKKKGLLWLLIRRWAVLGFRTFLLALTLDQVLLSYFPAWGFVSPWKWRDICDVWLPLYGILTAVLFGIHASYRISKYIYEEDIRPDESFRLFEKSEASLTAELLVALLAIVFGLFMAFHWPHLPFGPEYGVLLWLYITFWLAFILSMWYDL